MMRNPFCFWIPNNAGSSRIRGKQIADALGCKCIMRGLEPDGPGDSSEAAVFVKEIPSEAVINEARKKCDILIYDPVDNYQFDSMRGLKVDGVIACTINHCRKLKSVFPNSIVKVIPHHHFMLGGAGGDVSDSKRVGYVGDRSQMGIDEGKLRDAFPDVIITTDPAALADIGVGIAYRPEGKKRAYNSGVKLANCWAYGIAAVCSPDEAYAEMMGEYNVSAWVAYSGEEALDFIRLLVGDGELRRKVALSGSRKASRYDVSNIKRYYLAFLELLRDDARAKKEGFNAQRR